MLQQSGRRSERLVVLDEQRNREVLAFLRRYLTASEQQWPRFAPVLRSVQDVPIGQLGTHPDLVNRLLDLGAPHAAADGRILMGAPVLISGTGRIYAVAYSMRFLALRIAEITDARLQAPAEDALEPLGRDWRQVNVWLERVPAHKKPEALDALRRHVALARDAAG